MGLVTTRHVGSSWTRDQTLVPCIGGWILNHWTPREVLNLNSSCGLSIRQVLLLSWKFCCLRSCSQLTLLPPLALSSEQAEQMTAVGFPAGGVVAGLWALCGCSER